MDEMKLDEWSACSLDTQQFHNMMLCSVEWHIFYITAPIWVSCYYANCSRSRRFRRHSMIEGKPSKCSWSDEFISHRHHLGVLSVVQAEKHKLNHYNSRIKVNFPGQFSSRWAHCGRLTVRYIRQILTAIIRITFWLIWNDFDDDILTE